MNLRILYERLDADARRVLHASADLAAREGRRSISVELFLLALLRDRGVGAKVMQGLGDSGADAPGIETALAQHVAAEPRGKVGALPAFDESLAQLLREAWSLSFDEYGESQVAPLRFFETVARRGDLWPTLVASLPGFSGADLASLAMASRSGSAPPAAAPAASDPGYPELSRYGEDMVARARAEGFDPVVGFSTQLRAIAATLLRRRQNSVAVVGESGVGKTACALGFVDALARGIDTVPAALHDASVWSLDLSALRAGAVVRGALEERLQAIVQEVADQGMILYIDDLHLLFGDQSGGADALRNVLSDGKVRILATCGWREWRRHIEPDPGLARRIASVRVQEPDDAEALHIVASVAPTLAAHHGIEYGENTLDQAVALSRRYIVGRQLPDKAIAVLDSACARARMESAGAAAPEPAKVPAPTEVPDQAELVSVEARAVSEIPPVADALEGAAASVAADEPAVVTEDHVGVIVSDLTGVPIGSMLSDVSKMAGRLESVLGERVVGQDDALARCASQARAYLAGLSDRRRPVGALMFCGPSGVGKTETAHALADALFGGRLLTINMSEYQEAHTVSGLKGAPAGYVGYGEGGVLTEGIRRTPYSVVLLDEIEKAHKDVIEMLYQVLDRGWMEDAEGIEADFSNALIVLTTNAGDVVMDKAFTADPRPDDDALGQTLSRALHDHFPAAFIGRLQLVPYWPLGEDSLGTIAGMRLERLAEAYRASHRSELVFDDDVRDWLVQQVKATPQGARFLDGIVAKSIRPAVADFVLDRLGGGEPVGDATLVRDGDRFAAEPA
ncbi:MAG: AAA domain-containing protein [Gammaproteobacteria bacterium]|nr:AAA domain-containing protein [Gammaproteobacteria bacterium]